MSACMLFTAAVTHARAIAVLGVPLCTRALLDLDPGPLATFFNSLPSSAKSSLSRLASGRFQRLRDP